MFIKGRYEANKLRVWFNTKMAVWTAVGYGGISYPSEHPEQAVNEDFYKLNIRRFAAKAIPGCGYGRCGMCRLPWSVVNGHSTTYRDGVACFPLCELCWEMLNPKERLPFYESLYFRWVGDGREYDPGELEGMRMAVLSGK
jgi:hypothetical protein